VTTAFRFRLAAVLRYRRHVEDVRGLALARAARERDEMARRLTALRGDAAAARRALVARAQAGVEASDIQTLAAQVALSERLAAAATLDLAQCEASVLRARAALIEASRERQLLEQLERTQRDGHRALVEDARARELDDVATRYHERRRAAVSGADPA
jgi:flagellar export protein FliJ